jgi:4a-hydroxytetrahydrobiopterin dehydratase
MEQLNGWSFEQGHLAKSYAFNDFAGALEFVNRIGAIAEQQSHHPDIYMTWGKVSVEIWTHKIDGLTESDFILAAKFDEIPVPEQSRTSGRRDGEGDASEDDALDDTYDSADDGEDFDDAEEFDEAER